MGIVLASLGVLLVGVGAVLGLWTMQVIGETKFRDFKVMPTARPTRRSDYLHVGLPLALIMGVTIVTDSGKSLKVKPRESAQFGCDVLEQPLPKLKY